MESARAYEENATVAARNMKRNLKAVKKHLRRTNHLKNQIEGRAAQVKEVIRRGDQKYLEVHQSKAEILNMFDEMKNRFDSASSKVSEIEQALKERNIPAVKPVSIQVQKQMPAPNRFTPCFVATTAAVVGVSFAALMLADEQDSVIRQINNFSSIYPG